MKIICNSCNKEVLAVDLDLKDKVAKCRNCNSIFNFQEQVKSISSFYRQEIELPKQFEIEKSKYQLKIIRKWFSSVIIFLTIFAIFWDGFMIVWFSIAIIKGEWMMLAFGTIHAFVGIFMTYYVIAGYINKTYITVDSESVDIKHLPLPFFGNKHIYSSSFKQLYTKRIIHNGKHGVSYSYDLKVILNSGKEIKLLWGLQKMDHALYVEQQIEGFLKIEDEMVKTEVERN